MRCSCKRCCGSVGTFLCIAKSGDHVVFSSVTYIAVYRLLNELLKDKFGVETTIVDTTDIEKLRRQSVRTQSSSTLKHRATLLFQFPTLKSLQSLPMQTVHFCRLTTHLLLRSTKDRLNSVQTLPLKALQSTSTVTVMQWEVQSSAKRIP